MRLQPCTINVGWENPESWAARSQASLTVERFPDCLTQESMEEVGLRQTADEVKGDVALEPSWISAAGSPKNPAKFNDEAIIPDHTR